MQRGVSGWLDLRRVLVEVSVPRCQDIRYGEGTREHVGRKEGGKHTIFIVTQDPFKLCQVSILMCECNSTHTFYFAELCILHSEFDR